MIRHSCVSDPTPIIAGQRRSSTPYPLATQRTALENYTRDADLGGHLYKKRVARPGRGKSGGYRTLLSARIGGRYVFLHGFPKNDKANIAQGEKKALQFAGKVFLELSEDALARALQSGVLLEVHCEQDH
ncbi:type II toxin-antitoxin system RelE/ParE family toxin [Xanthomonas sacchari]|uniref:type II toxin-antitoxin system RelE/ParE family toxin n=1 Tax=Xanthomonas sacchari TaxID=56458 RepID=UPI002253E88F|nr:type II toxin-antitoxin system RelE/ParE family toxin [Xanthomonas sacchari]UYK83200.1 type II toxin-antitoxin system RelE/ParE family toxin [Xanthomonas sacchari]